MVSAHRAGMPCRRSSCPTPAPPPSAKRCCQAPGASPVHATDSTAEHKDRRIPHRVRYAWANVWPPFQCQPYWCQAAPAVDNVAHEQKRRTGGHVAPLGRHDRVVRKVQHGRPAEAAVREQHRAPLRGGRGLPPLGCGPCAQRHLAQGEPCSAVASCEASLKGTLCCRHITSSGLGVCGMLAMQNAVPHSRGLDAAAKKRPHLPTDCRPGAVPAAA